MAASKKWGYLIFSFIIVIVTIAILATSVNTVTPRIFGGQDAPDGKYPYMVSLRDHWNEHFCGGSILNNRWILTAAHCITNTPNDSIRVVAGTNLLKGGEEQVYQSERLVPHEHYLNALIGNDIGLIRVNRNIEFNKKVKPIQLTKRDINKAGHKVQICGWGYTKLYHIPNKLQEITLKIVDQNKCMKEIAAAMNVVINESHICNSSKYGKGACNGDSGSPVVASGVQIGIVSFGPECAIGAPDVNARVYPFLNWIAKKTK